MINFVINYSLMGLILKIKKKYYLKPKFLFFFIFKNLTEFNTAHNKRIAQLVDISAASKNIPTNGMLGPVLVKKKKKMVSFCEEEDVINPEDVDPSVGRFRNMIQTTLVIPNKVFSIKSFNLLLIVLRNLHFWKRRAN